MSKGIKLGKRTNLILESKRKESKAYWFLGKKNEACQNYDIRRKVKKKTKLLNKYLGKTI